jgi:ring-1,2-phenylacetyl-CoA epoxidase subunit PaaC
MAARTAPLEYLLHLADNALVLGQRNAEWCAHGPVLEEDIAMANIGLDLIGQARLLYQHAASIINAPTLAAEAAALPPEGAFAPWGGPASLKGQGATEDALAYFRDEKQFRNFTLLELPHHGPLAATASADRDYATTIVRNFLYSAFVLRQWEALQSSGDAQLAAIAARALKEVKYHLRHSRDWLVRLGDGTEESHLRTQAALDHLLPYCEEFWTLSAQEAAAIADGTGADPLTFRDRWNAEVDDALAEATLRRPAGKGFTPRGKHGQHSEHLSYLLGEMQSLARQHPDATW